MRINTLRDSIRALQAERAELLRQKRSRAEVGDALDALVTHWQGEGQRILARELQRLAEGGPGDPLGPLGPVLTLLLGPDAVKAALASQLADVPEGLPPQARADALVKTGVALDRAEREEEKLCEAEGLDRRPDARPEIVLA
jgi:hypothetical protein